MIRFEALNAKHGDALLLHYQWKNKKRLWLIDGGPKGVWKQTLKPRLEELRGNDSELVIDLAMLSHVDEDHVTGILQMTKGLAEREESAADFLDIKRFWHNSFHDIVGSSASLQAGMSSLAGMEAKAAAAMAGASPQLKVGDRSLDERAVAVLASIGQGRELRDYLTKLKLNGNQPFGGTLSSKSGSETVEGATVTLVGPIKSRLDAFRQKWKSESGNAAALAALFRNDLDESPTNLSSLVMLVVIAKRKILLTGDARGDDIVDGCKDAGLKLPLKLDILKMPHHGSDRNITKKFLESFPAKHYVISADGKYGNPDSDTVENIVMTRGDDDYTLHFTNEVKGLKTQLTKLKKKHSFEAEIRKKSAPSLTIELD